MTQLERLLRWVRRERPIGLAGSIVGKQTSKMEVNGAVHVEGCSSHTESNWRGGDPTEEMDFESFVNISPCKKEDLQSPALAGYGVFQTVGRMEQGNVCEDTTSMLIINEVDSLTQLEGTSIETVGMSIKIQVDPATPEKREGASVSLHSELLADSMTSSATVYETECSTQSEVISMGNTASRDSPIMTAFTVLTIASAAAAESDSKCFPRSFLASAESTPLRVHEQNILVTKGHRHEYIKGIPMTAPIREIDSSLELSTETSSIGDARGPQEESIEEAYLGEIQDCQELRISLENVQNSQEQSTETTSMGDSYASQNLNSDMPLMADDPCLQEPINGNASFEKTEGLKEQGTEMPSVEEGQIIETAYATNCLGPQEQTETEGDNGEKDQIKETIIAAEEKVERGAEEPCKDPDEAQRDVVRSAVDETAPEVKEHESQSDCDDMVLDTQHSFCTENAPGNTSQLEAVLTSIVLDDKDFVATKLAPADSLWTTSRDGAVQLRMEGTGPAAEPPITVHQMFQRTVQRYGRQPALAVKNDGVWETITYLEYHQQCRAAAKGFLKLGLERFHGVGILGFNSPEWFISDIGAIMAGGFAVGIYTTNSPEACQYVAENCDANILVVENHRQLVKILQIQDQLPHLKAIIQYHDELKEKRPNLYTWKEFIQLGTDVPDSQLDAIIATQKANQCCTLIYTSGTTGQPKGAMLSHDNLTWVVKRAGKMLDLGEEEVIVSYLPLSHIAAQVVDIWIPMFFGGITYFAEPDALKGSLITTLREVRPTGFLGVPRVWEKIQEKMKALGVKSSLIQRKVAAWAKGIGLQASYSRMNGDGALPWGYTLANILVFRRVHTALGLDRCVRCYTGAAPITKDTLEYFMSLDMTIMELYGMSESTGPHTISMHSAFRIMSAGKEVPGCKTLIYKPEEDGTGEICFWGRHVFMGYLNMEDKTKEALDEDGWLHSGDLGRQDQDGFLFITGRIKELIITAGGENIPPIPIEDAVKEELPVISNAVLIGDKMKFLSMLLTLKCNTDADTGEPQDDLTTEAIQFCQQLGSRATRVSQVVSSKDQAIYKAIQDGMDRVNRRAPSNAQKVQKWTILEKDFSISGGELGPTMKLKRPVVSKMYKDEIENFYKDKE